MAEQDDLSARLAWPGDPEPVDTSRVDEPRATDRSGDRRADELPRATIRDGDGALDEILERIDALSDDLRGLRAATDALAGELARVRAALDAAPSAVREDASIGNALAAVRAELEALRRRMQLRAKGSEVVLAPGQADAIAAAAVEQLVVALDLAGFGDRPRP